MTRKGDTDNKTTSIFQSLIMVKKPEERLVMGCSMFDAAKNIVKSSIISEYPDILPGEMKKQIVLRFYGLDFSENEKQKILNAI